MAIPDFALCPGAQINHFANMRKMASEFLAQAVQFSVVLYTQDKTFSSAAIPCRLAFTPYPLEVDAHLPVRV